MASVAKYTQKVVYAMLKHNERTSHTHSNTDIDPLKGIHNYRLSPLRECTDYDYFKQLLDNYKCMNRPDIIKLATWIITIPDNLPVEQEQIFFECCRNFLLERYGAENEIQCIVHYDEIHKYIDNKCGQSKYSRPHMHFSFIPATTDKNGNLHICAKKVLTRQDLRNFHPDLQRYLSKNGISGTIYTGITKSQGGNICVKDLKNPSASLCTKQFHERSFNF